jgi:cadherin 23
MFLSLYHRAHSLSLSFTYTHMISFIFFRILEHVKPGVDREEKIKLPDTVDRDEVDDLEDDPTTVCYFLVYGNEDNVFALDRVSHILTPKKELDREKKQNYSLIVKATEDCLNIPKSLNESSTVKIPKAAKLINRRQKSQGNRFTDSINLINGSALVQNELEIDSMIAGDSTLLRVLVNIQDINDNPPRFLKKIFTGGVSTSADFGTEIMTLRAVDADIGDNAKLSFKSMGKMHRTLTEGLDSIKDPSFILESDSGIIRLNFDPQKDMKGYFDFTVVVSDKGGFNDTAHVFIYLLREDQRVKFVLRQQNFELREKIERFRE